MQKPIVSVIIVHYLVESVLFDCIKSIAHNTSISYEIIVVDNGSKKGFSQRLEDKHPQARYFQTPENLGFGAGNNFGSQQARGSYLFFVNPDTVCADDCLDKLISFMESRANCAIAAPTLLDSKLVPFKKQGTLILTPLRALFAHSIIHSIWPENPISQAFWMTSANRKKNRRVEVVPGTAFVIQKDLFSKLGGFDPQFFLYFEEYDLCKRALEVEEEIWMLSDARLVHAWGATTAVSQSKAFYNDIYQNSFKLYLIKHYGVLIGNLSYAASAVSKFQLLTGILLFLVLILALI